MPKSADSANSSDRQPPSRIRRWADSIRNRWDDWEDRPDWNEIHFYYLPLVLTVGSTAVGTVDDVLDLHIADRMAAVQTDPNDNIVERSLEDVVRQVGQGALELEGKDDK